MAETNITCTIFFNSLAMSVAFALHVVKFTKN